MVLQVACRRCMLAEAGDREEDHEGYLLSVSMHGCRFIVRPTAVRLARAEDVSRHGVGDWGERVKYGVLFLVQTYYHLVCIR